MTEKAPQSNVVDGDVVRLIGIAAVLWLGYVLALAVIDAVFYPQPLFPPVFYVVSGLNALLVLGLAAWPGLRRQLGRAFVPTVIVLMSVVPVIIAHLFVSTVHPGPATAPENITLRLMPMSFMALALTAWQYRWRHVVWFSLGQAALSLSLMYLFTRAGQPVLPPITVLVVQTISLLIVGYFITSLVRQLRAQHDSLTQANAQLADYAATLEELTISRERNRLARELHDTLAHTLSALSVQLETVKAYWAIDPNAAQHMLDRSLVSTRSGLQETRRALKSLRASPLDDLGLLLALRQLLTETAARANLKLNLALPDYLPALSAAIEQCIYRVAQEAAANVAQHANARTLTVQLISDDRVVLHISDDGQGFDLHAAEVAGHFGLSGLRERAQLVGGTLEISSRPGQGTTIQLVIEGHA